MSPLKTSKRWFRFFSSGIPMQQRLPLYIFVLLLSTITAYSWISYISVKRAAFQIGEQRLSSLTTQLSSMFGQSAQTLITGTLNAAQQPAVKNFLKTGTGGNDTAVSSILKKLRLDSTWVLIELLDRDKKQVLSSGLAGRSVAIDRDSAIAYTNLTPSSCRIGRLYGVNDSIYYPIIAAVSDERQIIGYLIRWRLQITTIRSIAQFSQLLGTDAKLYIGNKDGSLWTDLAKPVAGPPAHPKKHSNLLQYKRPNSIMVVASEQPVANTPWVVLVEFPEQLVMGVAANFLRKTIFIGILLTVIGSFITWLLSRNIIIPIKKLTLTAAAITKGDYSHRVKMRREDEIGELARAFNTMMTEIRNAQQTLQKKVEERTVELKTNLARLKESEEKFQKAFQASTAGITITKLPESKYVDVNDSFIKMSGYHREELIGHTSVGLGLTLDVQRREAATQQVMQTGSSRNYELSFINKSGSQFEVLVSSDMITLNGENYAINIMYDITDQKRNQAIIQKQKQDMQDFIDSMSTLCAKVATDGRLLLVNKIAAQASGLSLEELMRTNFLEGQWWTFNDQVKERVTDAFQKACAGTATNYDEIIYVFGKVLPISFSLTPIFNAAGEVDYIVAEARDISSLKETEAHLQQQSAELEKANKELEAFSYSVSHDLRAPLRIIDGYVDIVQTDYAGKLDEEGRHMLDIIAGNARKMGKLIDDLLDLSRLGRKDLLVLPVNMNRLVESVITEHFDIQPERVKLQVDKLENAECDSSLIRQVWINLISNAVKYSRDREKSQITISSQKKDTCIVYSIRDNGVGFDMQYADKLFGVFQRLHKMSDYEGTGVGLALVQRIVTKHGGQVWAEAEKDKGATFYFSLPDKKIDPTDNILTYQIKDITV